MRPLLDPTATQRARALADQLAGLPGIDPRWAAVFARVPRHVFVPAFYPTLDTDGEDPPQPVDETEDPDRWLDAVYRDQSLVTQYALTPGTSNLWQSTSSSTRPSLMARMLTLLDTDTDDGSSRAGKRVLEIGTGTGYNAAILSHRLGASTVASIDLDPHLVGLAHERLATLDYHPVLASTNGADGLPGHGPYDRILATCAISRVPPAWIDQLAPGGLIVADMRGGLASSLLVARRDTNPTGGACGAVSGRFLAEPGHFMWLRRAVDNPLRDAGTFVTSIDYDDARPARTTIEPTLLTQPDFRFLLQLIAPVIDRIWTSHRDGTSIVRIAATDHSWAELTPSTHTALQNGPTDLLDKIEHAAQLWHKHHHPAPTRLGITDTPDQRTIWLDNHDQPLAQQPAP
jgi:protein-L-isoaspartate O-methyltransferase